MEEIWPAVCVAAAACTYVASEEEWLLRGQRRPPRYWVSEYLLDRTDSSQRNTFAKLEYSLVQVCTPIKTARY